MCVFLFSISTNGFNGLFSSISFDLYHQYGRLDVSVYDTEKGLAVINTLVLFHSIPFGGERQRTSSFYFHVPVLHLQFP